MANNMSITAKIIRAIALLLVAFGVSACSTYPNRFKCGDAKGLGCTMLHEVDAQIDSGQIEEAYKVKSKTKDKKCKSGGVCPAGESDAALKLKKRDRAGLYPDETPEHLENEDNLSF